MVGLHPQKHITCPKCYLNRRLKTGYKDLEVYKEAAAMVTEKLKK